MFASHGGIIQVLKPLDSARAWRSAGHTVQVDPAFHLGGNMSEKLHIPIGMRLMAFVCRICPCCIITRHWPDSWYAKHFSKVQHHCCFCRAYKEVRQIRIAFESEQAEKLAVKNLGGTEGMDRRPK